MVSMYAHKNEGTNDGLTYRTYHVFRQCVGLALIGTGHQQLQQ